MAPRIHDGDRTCLFNIDDLKRIREQTLADRLKHVGPAEAIIHQEVEKFLKDWSRRRLVVFVDVANILNRTNLRNASYSVDRVGRVFETTESLMPIVPSGGFVIEF